MQQHPRIYLNRQHFLYVFLLENVGGNTKNDLFILFQLLCKDSSDYLIISRKTLLVCIET